MSNSDAKDVVEFTHALSVSISESNPVLGTPDEIQVVMSDLPIPNKNRYLNDIENSVRLIKGVKVLTEGTFNGAFYPAGVVERDAPNWMEHERIGMTRKVNLDHTSSVKDRCGHITRSYFENGWMKQDFLLLRTKKENDAIDLWDAGLLDDVSVRLRGGIDMKNSTVKKPLVRYMKGISTDFVDRPACKTCGLDNILSTLAEKENDNQLTDEEDKSMADDDKNDKTFFQQLKEAAADKPDEFKAWLKELVEKEEEVDDDDKNLDDDDDDTQLCSGGGGSGKKKKGKVPDEDELDDDESDDDTKLDDEGGDEMKDVLTRLESLEQANTDKDNEIQQLQQQNTELSSWKETQEQAIVDQKHAELAEEVIKYTKLVPELKNDIDEEAIKALTDDELNGRLFGLKLKVKDIPKGKAPLVKDSSLSDLSTGDETALNEANSKITELNEALKNKAPKV
jgi:hypothetical protein